MNIRSSIEVLVSAIDPYDELEQQHKSATLAWIRDGAQLYRIAKPDIPPQHLVAYFVLVDQAQGKILLVDHKNAGLWLPSGGHVEVDEHPTATVIRELHEELNLSATFLWPEPIFLTVTRTTGASAGHTDVSLWYGLAGDSTQPLRFDADEFYTVQWFPWPTVPTTRTDPHLHRFLAKMRLKLE